MEEQPEKTENTEPEVPAHKEHVEQPSQESDKPKKAGKLSHKHHWQRFKTWYTTHKKLSIPLTSLLLVLILAGIPITRFTIAGLVVKKDFTVHVTDSKASTPVSGALVSVGPVSALTDGSGKATLHGVKVGSRGISITKKYYQDKVYTTVVPILSEKNVPGITLVATGRQVKVSIVNLITQKAIAGVEIQVGGTTSKTDSSGKALLVLPADVSAQKAKLSLDGYNDASVTVAVSNTTIKQNNYQLTPAGRIYYLSNKTGNLDVMKANLDGTDPQVAVKATGNEDPNNTSLMQSPDGKYVALLAIRNQDDQTPQLYVLATADDKVLEADNGTATFSVYGWAGDKLIYTVNRTDLPFWQQGVNKLKAYDASTGAITLLDQAAGSDEVSNINEYYSTVMLTSNYVIYAKTWQGGSYYNSTNSKQDSLQVISVTGQNHQTLANYNSFDYISYSQHGPDTIYIDQNTNGTDNQTYTQYTVGGSVQPLTVTSTQFYQNQHASYYSPSGKQTLWAEVRDGKNAIMLADPNGKDPATIASLEDDTPSGWYTDQYILLTKNNDELYIMGVGGGTPVKVADYQSASYGYGYGYR